MANIYNTFEFTGAINIKNNSEKFKSHEVVKYESGWIKERLLFNVQSDDSSQLVELSDMYSGKQGYKLKKKTPKTQQADGTYKEGTDLEISWKDRNSKAILDKVANWQKFVLDFSNNKERYDLKTTIEKLKENEITEDDVKLKYGTSNIEELQAKLEMLKGMRYEFLNKVDMIEKLRSELPKYKNMKFKVSGDINFYQSIKKNTVGTNFMVKKIEKALDSDKKKLIGYIDIFFNEDTLDKEVFEDTKKYIVNGYVKSYDSQLKKDIYLPYPLIIDASKLDMNNPKHKGRLKMLVSPMENCKEDVIYELQYKVKFVNGSERKEITLDDLSDLQRMAVECGMEDFEELKRKLGGSLFGKSISETRIVGFNLKDFPEGAIETELQLSDIIEEENVEQVDDTEEMEDILLPFDEDDAEDYF